MECAQSIAVELGIDLEEASVGGGSDGNFTAAIGIPTLDGLGACGKGIHAEYEHIQIDKLAERLDRTGEDKMDNKRRKSRHSSQE